MNKELWEQHAERLKQVMIEHRRKLETDEQYREEYNRISEWADKFIVHFWDDDKS